MKSRADIDNNKGRANGSASRGGADATSREAKCPICGVMFDRGVESYPFCSHRCRTIDLGRWLDGKYVISRPIEHSDLDEGE